MKLAIEIPSSIDQREINYTLMVMFEEFLGIEYFTKATDSQHIVIRSDKDQFPRLTFPCLFYSQAKHLWLKKETLPKLPIVFFDTAQLPVQPFPLKGVSVPVLFGKPQCKYDDNEISFDFDLFGCVFFILSQYEEACADIHDSHGRFMGKQSIAAKNHYIDRPVVNEYIEILWHSLFHFWPNLNRKERKFSIHPSCDIDHLRWPWGYSPVKIGLKLAKDLLKDKSISAFLTSAHAYFRILRKGYTEDPYNTFDYIMNVCDQRGLTCTFFFLCGRTDPRFDGSYNIEDPMLLNIISNIFAKGHRLGLHGSYNAVNSDLQTKQEVQLFHATMRRINSEVHTIRSRQHYLRWDVLKTPAILEKQKVHCDYTLGYADIAGFRTGCCYPYPLYDLVTRKPLKLRVFPLIVMECSVLDLQYMGLQDSQQAIEYINKLKDQCRKYDGILEILWHNTRLIKDSDRQLYELAISD